MLDVIAAIKKIAPDQLSILVRRYHVLKTIKILQPTGRRSVAQYMDLSERIVRGEVDKLSEEGLIEIAKAGMSVTVSGNSVLDALEDFTSQILGISIMEAELEKLLGIRKIFVVQGSCEENENVKKEIGLVGAQVLLKNISPKSTVAITGGSTVEALVDSIPDFSSKRAKIVVPARGGVGHKIEQQADTLASRLAKKLGSEYMLLNIPDNLGEIALNEIKNEPNVQDALEEMEQANILLFGIGNALEMAEKRRLSDAIYDFLMRNGAIAEAFGYYFNQKGEIIYSARSIGISLEQVKKISNVIAVAGGAKKAKSIIAVTKVIKNITLIIDEGAAMEILKIFDYQMR